MDVEYFEYERLLSKMAFNWNDEAYFQNQESVDTGIRIDPYKL